jgi:DNA replication and repair protein RecF
MLESITLANFRNYESKAFDLERITVFIGENGIGKTNILEAVGFLALARSFRARQDREVIRWGEEVARIVGKTDQAQIEIGLTQQLRGGKLIKINGVNRRAIELLGHLSVILFLPESLSLVAGPPQLRRQFLDLLLIQEDRKYAYHLVQLQKILRQRNKLLKQIDEGIASADQLAFWDDGLVEHGSYLVAARIAVLREINNTVSDHYYVMSDKKEKLQLSYKAASASESAGDQEKYTIPTDCPITVEEWAKILRDTVESHRSREIAAGNSLYGPQRDDFVFILDDKQLASFGSRGEFRSAVLALKASEAHYLATQQDDQSKPLIFLLDDVYSELDENRRQQLAKLIGDNQAIITTTDLSHIDPELQKIAKVVTLT